MSGGVMELPELVVPHRNGMDFGIGVEAGSQQLRHLAVSGEPTGPQQAGGASEQKFEVTQLTSSSELATKLSIDVKASAGFGSFGAGASARFSFLEESKMSTSSVNMAVTCTIVLEDLSIDSPALLDEAVAVAGQPDVFRERYGDMFVRGCKRGGLFVGLITIDSSESSKSQEISASLKGSYGFFSAEASTSFSSLAKNSDVKIYCHMYSEGGPAFDTSHTDNPQILLDYANRWFQALHDDPGKNAKPLNWYLSPMTIASGPLPPNAADILHAQDVLTFCTRERLTLLDQKNLMERMSQNPEEFDFVAPTTPATVAESFRGYQTDLDLLAETASAAMNDISKAEMPATLAEKTGRTYPKGVPPFPMPTMSKGKENVLAAQGKAYCADDELLTALRGTVPEGAGRDGFDVGVAVMHANSQWGPGAQQFKDDLDASGAAGFLVAANFCMSRNRHPDLAATGASVDRQDPTVLAERDKQSPGQSQLAFDIASALYGDKALGALGSTLKGPGSDAIEASVIDGAAGFDASFTFHTSRHYAA